MLHLSEPVKIIVDALAVIFSFVVWLTTLLPAMASAVTLAWGIIRIYEWWKSKKGQKDGNKQLNRLDP